MGGTGAGVASSRAVAERPHAVVPGYAQPGVDRDAVPDSVDRQSRDERIRTRRHCADERASQNPLAGVENRRGAGRRGKAALQPDLDAAPAEYLLGEEAEALVQFRKDALTRVQQHDPRVVRVDALVVLDHLADEVVELGGDLDAGEPAARHHEGHQATARVPIGLHGRFFEQVQDVVAEVQRVADRLERHSVLRPPGHPAEGGDVAEREHEMVERQDDGAQTRAGRQGHRPPVEVDARDLARVQRRSRAQPAQWRDRIDDADARRHNLGDERLKDEVVLAAGQRHLDVRPPAQPALEVHRRVRPANPSPRMTMRVLTTASSRRAAAAPARQPADLR